MRARAESGAPNKGFPLQLRPSVRLSGELPATGGLKKWRRGELNPCPENRCHKHLHAYLVLDLGGSLWTSTLLTAERPRAISHPARSLRLQESLLSSSPRLAGVNGETKRSLSR